jgi:predicted acetyltransferase
MPELVLPTPAVRDSFLAGERAACAVDGTSPSWLDSVEADFDGHVARRRQTRRMWGVPTSEFWFVSGPVYYGAVTIRHQLTPQLRREGGHIGYVVMPAYRRHGHATAMLGGACTICRAWDMTDLLLTCGEDNTASRRVIEANGGVLEAVTDGICRYWIRQ